MTHVCKKDRCGSRGHNSRACRKGQFPRKANNTFTVSGAGRIIPPGGNDDENIVSYNPILLSKYKCHVNLDAVGTFAVVKYLFKYMSKGTDRLNFRRTDGEVQVAEDDQNKNRDEIGEYIQTRYVSGAEGSYLISAIHMHGIKPSVIALHLHTESGFSISYDMRNHNSVEEMIERQESNDSKTSMLFGFFRLNERIEAYVNYMERDTQDENFDTSTYDHYDAKFLYKNFNKIDLGELKKGLPYKNAIKLFRWDTGKKEWVARVKNSGALAYVPSVSCFSKEKDRYFISLLLDVVESPKCFDDLKCGLGSYDAACRQRGLIGTDYEYIRCLETMGQTPDICRLFVNMLLTG